MSYLYQSRCFDTSQQLYNAIAADCQTISDGHVISCVPFADRVDVTKTNIDTAISNTFSYFPALIDCGYTFTTLTDSLMFSALILVAGFSIRQIIKVM